MNSVTHAFWNILECKKAQNNNKYASYWGQNGSVVDYCSIGSANADV